MAGQETQIGRGAKVAVVDDERFMAEVAADIAEEAELVPIIFSDGDGPFRDVAQLLERIRKRGCIAVVCDHRLSGTPFASFLGAELMASLYNEHIPGLLLSTFAGVDSDSTIRRYRASIPCLVSRGHLDPDNMLRGLRLCESELNGHFAPERYSRRTLMRVVGVGPSSVDGGVAVDAIMHSWDPDCGVRFPLDLIEDRQIQQRLLNDFNGEMHLFAQVNVDCQDSMDLFFRDFELAPEPHADFFAT